MKRITYNGGAIVTGDAATSALLEYATTVADAESSQTVDITVLEDNGETSVHTLLISATSQFNVADVAEAQEHDEARRFPVPHFPKVGIRGTVEKNGDAQATARDFDAMMGDIDEGLGL